MSVLKAEKSKRSARGFSFLLRIADRLISYYSRLRYATYRSRYDIDKSFRFNGRDILLYGSGRVLLGQNSYLGDYSWVQSVAGCVVDIGRNCSLSHMIAIYTSNNIADQDFLGTDLVSKSGNVVIEDGCWIGTKVSLMGPVTVGTNCVVAAHSLVTKSLPPHSVCGGSPAKVICFKSYLPHEDACELAVRFSDVLSDRAASKYKIARQH